MRVIIMQAANTGLTGASTPDGRDYDREIVIVSTLRMARIHLINEGRQLICLPGVTLFQLENALKPLGAPGVPRYSAASATTPGAH